MTKDQLLAKFNPANAANLSAQDLIEMRNLTDDQINDLANEYPNQPTRRPYLRLYDTTKPENKQLFNLSTWQNLRNVRKFSNMKNLVPYDFVATPGAFSQQQRQQPKIAGKVTSNPRKVVVDLSAKEAARMLKADIEKPATQKSPNVEKKSQGIGKESQAKTTKSATSPKKNAGKAAAKEAAVPVEKSQQIPGTDASEEFEPVN